MNKLSGSVKNRYYTLILAEKREEQILHFDLGQETIPYYFLEIKMRRYLLLSLLKIFTKNIKET